MINRLKGYLHRKWFDKNYKEKISKVKIELDSFYAMELATVLCNIDVEKLHTDYQKSIGHFLYELSKSISSEQIEDAKSKNALNELIKNVNSGAN